jgi:selT/selW/selH-like putative selenoprotein
MEEVLKAFEADIESFTLVPSDGGRFEFTVNDQLLYSKLQTNRHVESGEMTRLVKKYMMEVR